MDALRRLAPTDGSISSAGYDSSLEP